MRVEIYEALRGALERQELVILATVLTGSDRGRQRLIRPHGESLGDLGSARWNRLATRYGEQIAPGTGSRCETLPGDGEEVEIFFDVLPPPSQLVVVGAVHIAVPLVAMAGALGFRTVVVDPRQAFATRERFPDADRISTLWPREALREIGLHESTAVAVLSHDLKIDLPALAAALESRAGYIGALGSQRTHRRRVEALADLGFEAAQIGRIHSPIGLDLGGRRAEEIALAILAEVVATRHGRRLQGRSASEGE